MKRTTALITSAALLAALLAGCGQTAPAGSASAPASSASSAASGQTDPDQAAADQAAALIDAIYVQQRTDDTDARCAAAKAAWDALTDTQKALVQGKNASPDYFGLDTGDASQDAPPERRRHRGKGDPGGELRHLLQQRPGPGHPGH